MKSNTDVQYGEFRSGFDRDTEDTRMVVYGLRYLLQTYLHRQWTIEDVEKADKFYRSGNSDQRALAEP